MLLNNMWDNLASFRAEQIARQQRAGSIPIDRLNASNDK
jgi:hypothetical protein